MPLTPEQRSADRQMLTTILDGISNRVAGGQRQALSTEDFVPEALTTPEATDPAVLEGAPSSQAQGSKSSSGALAWGGFSNGNIPTGEMASVGEGHSLMPEAASSFREMAAAAAAEGVTLSIGSSYRSYDTQAAAYSNWKATGNNLNGTPVPSIASPGNSNHGWGRALDLGGNGAYKWLANNAASFGWFTISNEPWHWEFR